MDEGVLAAVIQRNETMPLVALNHFRSNPKRRRARNLYAGNLAFRSASDNGPAIDAWMPAAAHIPLMV
jgi:hypothetical protein